MKIEIQRSGNVNVRRTICIIGEHEFNYSDLVAIANVMRERPDNQPIQFSNAELVNKLIALQILRFAGGHLRGRQFAAFIEALDALTEELDNE